MRQADECFSKKHLKKNKKKMKNQFNTSQAPVENSRTIAGHQEWMANNPAPPPPPPASPLMVAKLGSDARLSDGPAGAPAAATDIDFLAGNDATGTGPAAAAPLDNSADWFADFAPVSNGSTGELEMKQFDWRYLAQFLLPVLQFGVAFLTIDGMWDAAMAWQLVPAIALAYTGTDIGKEIVKGGMAIVKISR